MADTLPTLRFPECPLQLRIEAGRRHDRPIDGHIADNCNRGWWCRFGHCRHSPLFAWKLSVMSRMRVDCAARSRPPCEGFRGDSEGTVLGEQSPSYEELAARVAELEAAEPVAGQLEERDRELAEALEQQTAMAEVLRIISNSPADAAPVLEALAERATLLSAGQETAISIIEGAFARNVADFAMPGVDPIETLGMVLPLEGRILGEAIRTERTLHVWGSVEEIGERFPGAAASCRRRVTTGSGCSP